MGYGSIYILLFPNGKVYIGQTNNFAKRMTAYPSYINHGKTLLVQAMKHYGWENVIKKELVRVELTELDYYERALIKGYDSTNTEFGYNLETGGKKHKQATEALRKKLSLAHLGVKPSEETRKKLSIAISAMYRNPETYIKIANANRGRKNSLETIEKIRETKVEGYKMGKYKKTNIPVVALDKDTLGDKIYFESATEAGKSLSTSNKNITQCLRGQRRLARGYAWRYANEDLPRYIKRARKEREWTPEQLLKAKIDSTRPRPEQRKPVIAIDPVTNKILFKFDKLTDVSSAGFEKSSVCECTKNKRRHHKGLLWRYDMKEVV
jgi:group I intron endonuclease